MNATDVSTAWCGACSLTTDQTICPRCSAPVEGPVADELRRLSLWHQDALVRGRLDDARSLAHRHETLRATASSPARPSFAPPAAQRPDRAGDGAGDGSVWTPMPAPERRPPVDPSRIITWAGAALLIAGALTFAGVIWQYAGGMGRMGILALVTLAAAVGADRLRRRAPVTAEALTAVFAAMVVVDAVAAVVAGYVDVHVVLDWTTCISTTAAVLFIALARRWRSLTAKICSVGFSGIAGVSAAAWSAGLQSGFAGVMAWQILLGATVLTGAAYVSRRLPRGTERTALLVATWSAWTVFSAACSVSVALVQVVGSWATTDATRVALGLVPALTLVLLVAPPLVVRCLGVGSAWLAGSAAGLQLMLAVVISVGHLPDIAAGSPTVRAALAGALLALPVAVSLTLVLVTSRRESTDDRGATWPDAPGAAQSAALAVLSSLTVGFGVVWQVAQTRDLAGAATAALVVVLPAAAIAVATALLAGRIHSSLETALAVSALVLGLVTLTLATAETVALSSGSVLGIAAGALAAVALVVRRPAQWWALVMASGGALIVSGVLGVDEVELWSIPAAILALTLGIAVRRTDDSLPSWVTVTPASALALVPSLVVGLAGSHPGLRLTVVSALATLVLLEGARRRLKGPTAVAVATLATVLLWMIAPHVHQAPSWVVLVTCGAAMLWVGFTWEARRDSAKHAWQRWAEWQ